MRKIHVLGLASLALLAVFAFGAAVAPSAFAELGQWLVNGGVLTVTLNAETSGLLTLVRLKSELNSEVLTEIDCEGVLDGTITQVAGVKGTDTITALFNTAQELINELGQSPELELNCLVTLDAGELTDCKENTLAWLWPDNIYNAAGPWLTELLELESNGLVLDGLFGKGVLGEEPGYEVRCETLLNVFGEELCEGPTSFDLTNGVGTINSKADLEISPEVHCILGGVTEEKVAGLAGEGLLCATTATLVCVSETAVSFAEGQWLVNGGILSGTLNAETRGLLTLIRLKSETNSEVLNEFDCEWIFDGTITQAAGLKGTDTITALLNIAQELINELGETNPLALDCLVTFDSGSLVDCKAETLVELWLDNLYSANGPWLTELLALESNGLVLDELFGTGVLGQNQPS